MVAIAPAEVRRKLLPKQMRFVRAEDRFLMYSGCFGGGKSVAICAKILSRASKPGAREGLCRKTLVSLKATTLRTLLDGDGPDVPAMLPPGTYTHNKAEKVIKIKGGGEIVYFGLDDPTKIGSYNLSGCGIDEAVEISLDDWIMLQGRIRTRVPGLPNQIYGATNPGKPSHWIAESFGLSGGDEPEEDYAAISTRVTDNHYLDPAYVKSLSRLEGVSYKRFFLGLWAGAEGVVYDRFNRDEHVAIRSDGWAKSIIACDYGYNDPFAAISLRMDHKGAIHQDREIYESSLTEPEMIGLVEGMIDDHSTVIVDNSIPALIESMRRKGLPAFPCVKGKDSVKNGIMHVQSLLGQGQFTIDPSCVKTIDEFESYEWRKTRDGKTTDTPVDSMNHAMDAIRYGVAELTKGRSLFIDDTKKRKPASRLQRFLEDD